MSVRAYLSTAFACPYEGEIDQFEKTATHFLGEVDGQPVATGRLRHLEEGWVKVERIAVRPRWRGRGYAKEIVAFMLDHARAQGARKFKMHAQVYLEDFYREFGFEREGLSVGAILDEEDIRAAGAAQAG